MKPVAIVTGANKGLGLGTAKALAEKNYKVILTARDEKKGLEAWQALKKQNLDVEFEVLDVSDEASINSFYHRVSKKYDRLDVLVNNAGIFIDGQVGAAEDVTKTTSSTLLKTFQTNTLGPFLLIQKFLPGMLKSGHGRIVNLSSGMGQLSEMLGQYPGYRISKTGLNAVTKIFANETQGSDVLINAVCPGWVKTDMGGQGATRNLDQGVKGIVWAATLPKGGPNGGFFRDGERLPW